MNASAAGIGDPLAGMFPAAEYQPRQQQQQQQPFLGRGGGIPPHLLAAAGLSSAGGAGANLNLPLLQYLAASQSIPSYGGLPAHIQASALLQGTPYHSTSSLLAQQLQATSQVARNQTASVENATMCAHRRAGGGPGNRALTGRKPVPLYVPTDDESISAYQCLARKQIELFEGMVYV